MKMKDQFYDIHASLLVPVYNMPKEQHSMYIVTQKGKNYRGSIEIDVWLVNAKRENPKESMIDSLRKEESIYSEELEKALAEEKPLTELQKSPKVRGLEHAKKVFSELVKEASCMIYHKKPDEEFLKIARRNLGAHNFAVLQPDLNNHLYLAALSRYEER